MRIRLVTSQDSRLIFSWRNDPQTRKMSLNSQEIPWITHCRWLERSITNPRILLLICEHETFHEEIAIVRFDLSDDAAEVSINVSPHMRGKKIAKRCLKMAISFLKIQSPEVKIITALVKDINFASHSVFKSLEFKPIKKEKNIIVYEHVLENG